MSSPNLWLPLDLVDDEVAFLEQHTVVAKAEDFRGRADTKHEGNCALAQNLLPLDAVADS